MRRVDRSRRRRESSGKRIGRLRHPLKPEGEGKIPELVYRFFFPFYLLLITKSRRRIEEGRLVESQLGKSWSSLKYTSAFPRYVTAHRFVPFQPCFQLTRIESHIKLAAKELCENHSMRVAHRPVLRRGKASAYEFEQIILFHVDSLAQR